MPRAASIVVALITAFALICGCAAHRADVSIAFDHGNCAATDVGVRRIDAATLARLRATRLIGEPVPPADDRIQRALLIAIAPGEFPTAGYRVVLADAVEPAAGELTLTIEITRPPTGSMLAQVVTRPCLVVGIDDTSLRRVRVFDSAGTPLGEIDMAAPR